MGVSMALSFSSIKITDNKVDQSAWNHVFRRSAILFGLGLFLNNGIIITYLSFLHLI